VSARRWRSPDGITVSAVTISHARPFGRDGDWLVIRHPNGVTIAEIRQTADALGWLAEQLGGLEVDRGSVAS
jgi:hypothetical protein